MDQEHEKSDFDEFKKKIFNFTYELVSNDFSTLFYLCLIIVENVQFIAYYNNGTITFNTLGFSTFSSISRFVNLLTPLKEGNINVYLVPFFFFMNIVHVVLMVIGYRAYQERTERINKSISDRNFHKNKVQYFINLFTIGYTTVLTIPIFQTSITAFFCSSSNPFTSSQQCFIGTHILIAILGIFNIGWLVLINFFYAMYYFNRNPFSDSFMTCSSNWFNLGKFLVKIAPMIYMMYDPAIEFPVLFLIVMNVAYTGYLAVFSKFLFSFYRYNFKLQKILTGIQFFVSMFNIHFIVVYVFQDVNSQPSLLMIAWTLMSILLSLIVVNITERMKKSLLTDINSIEKKKLPEILEYLIYLINDTESKFRAGAGDFYVSSIAKTHKVQCDQEKCYCELFFREQQRGGYHKNKAVFYTLLLAIIDRIIRNNKKAYPFFILKAYILFYKMESQIKAATTISEVMSDKLDFTDDMLIKGLLFELNQQYSDTRDMEIYRKFNEFLLRQEEESLNLTELYISYWEELIDQNSSIPKLQMLLKNIKQSKSNLEDIVDGGLKIFHNHVRVLFLYKNLLKEVANDYLGSIRCEERYKIALKQNKLSNVDTVNKIQFRPNENLLVINSTRNYSTHHETLGKYKIISISSNVKQFLGFTNNQLVNESINKLLPRIYHSIHDEYIDNMLDRKNSDLQSKQIRVFPNTTSGCIIQCNLISKFMPSIAYGINIVSFMEQCDKEKDQFFIIYNGNTGIVDSMTLEAEMMLKDDSHRGGRNVLAIPDNIADLLPHWDYKQEVWRERSKRGKSAKTINALTDCSVDVKQIELYRSDGYTEKFIKILKFRGTFYTKMLSLENESIRESNTIQKYLEHKRQISMTSEYCQNQKMDTAQIQGVLQFDISNVIERDKERKKTMNSLKKMQREKIIDIEENPPKVLRWCFWGFQTGIFLALIILCSMITYLMYVNVHNYQGDVELIIDFNGIESQIADATYIFYLTITETAYTSSTMTLPYSKYSESSVDIDEQMLEIEQKFELIRNLVNSANNLMIEKLETGEFRTQDITLDIKYSKSAGTMNYYTKSMTIIQATQQYLTYGQQLIYRLQTLQENVETIIPSTLFFFILMNNLEAFPKKIQAAKTIMINQIENTLNKADSLQLIVKIVMGGLVLSSILTTLVFYRYILNNHILRVLAMYEQINLEKIADYKTKCSRYRMSLKGKDDKEKQSEKTLTKTLQILGETFTKPEHSQEKSQEESKLLEVPVGGKEEEPQEHFLSFESKPSLRKMLYSSIFWVVSYIVMTVALTITFNNRSQDMVRTINTLSRYTDIQNSIIEIRSYNFFSLNLLNYWNQSDIDSIKKELVVHMDKTLELMNDTSLNLTTFRPFISAKYHQLKMVQDIIEENNSTLIQSKLYDIVEMMKDMDQLNSFLYSQSLYYQSIAKEMGAEMSYHLNATIILTFIFFILFWLLGVRYIYVNICEEHAITYEMYNIIGYNLRKEIDAAK